MLIFSPFNFLVALFTGFMIVIALILFNLGSKSKTGRNLTGDDSSENKN
jgi:hypothetical protein